MTDPQTTDTLIPGVGIEPSPPARDLAARIMRRIKSGLDAAGVNVEPQFTGLSQLIELYLRAAREEGRAGQWNHP